MSKNKILFIGNSEKFINSVCKALVCEEYEVIPWRNIENNLKFRGKNNIVVICGYHHNSYHLKYNEYFDINVNIPYQNIVNNINKEVKIYYINTGYPINTYTLSRYCYAKHNLCIKLNDYFNNFLSIEIPLLLNNNNNIEFYASFLEKKIALIILKIKKYKYISIEDLPEFIKKSIAKDEKYLLKKINGKYLLFFRTRFIDKILRTIFG